MVVLAEACGEEEEKKPRNFNLGFHTSILQLREHRWSTKHWGLW